MANNDPNSWLDEYVAEQAEQKAIMDSVCAPYTAAELCEIIDEASENEVRKHKHD
jgi:hypothetical protein